MMIYIGDGSFLPDVPARDLSDEEVKQFGEAALLASGLYAQPARKAKAERTEEGDE